MDDWSKAFFQTLDDIANEATGFISEINEEFNRVNEQIIELSEDFFEQAETIFEAEAEEFGEFLEMLLVTFEASFLDPIFTDTPEESPQNVHSACHGCRHYHGQVYGGNLLVCAMHPYGPGTDNPECRDWEKD